MTRKFVKKPIPIEAIQWDGTEEMAAVIASEDQFEGILDFTAGTFNGFYIKTLEGKMKVSPGDYVIKGIKGEYYPCKPDIFEMMYDEVTN
jgi:hypothetical protein